tara:strand:- start:1568 stop:1897 length:330 start_codon:yes stop_codon:yes gene_type:complete
MDLNTGKPNHIEDWLVRHRTGQWFGWTDPFNKIYANLVVYDGGSKPTESECTDGLAALISAWDLENNSYKSKRRAEYPPIEEQLDKIYHSGVNAWKASIKTIKDKYPKP